MSRVPFATALLVRNEAGRYLSEVLDHHARYGPLIVLDDGSTDGTYDLCLQHPAVMVCAQRQAVKAWGAESSARAELWDLAAQHAEWVLVCDADQLLIGDPRDLIRATEVNAWAFVLYDLWDGRGTYRADGYWQAHLHPRPWLFAPHRTPADFRPEWSGRGIHTGHSPTNFPLRAAVAPESHHWLHLGYLEPVDRQAKLDRYREVGSQMTDFEKAHAESIATTPSLRVLPSEQTTTVVIGGSVRKPLPILEAHLKSLEAQVLPERVKVRYAFVADYPDPADPALHFLDEWLRLRDGVLIEPLPSSHGDFNDQHPQTHVWTTSAMQRVGEHKNRIFRWAIQNNADFVWLVDSDLILERRVLWNLMAVKQPIVSSVYWTRWHKGGEKVIHAAPQVWLGGVYEPFQSGKPCRGQTVEEFRAKLVRRELTQVWGLGACTLIHRSAIEKGVGFHTHPDLPKGGLWDGEDRHFCAWATSLHVPMFGDPFPDIFHVYHADDLSRIPEIQARFNQGEAASPSLGDLVNVRLLPLEEPGVGTQTVRCRVGDGALMPDIEGRVVTMQRGDTAIVPVQFPAHYPFVQYRGKQRLVEVTLVDFKPFGFAPVLEDEMLAGPGQTAFKDATTLTREQIGALA